MFVIKNGDDPLLLKKKLESGWRCPPCPEAAAVPQQFAHQGDED